MNPIYNFDTICKLACDLAGNPGLYQVPADDTEPRSYKLLKLMLHKFFLTYDWEFNLITNQAWSVAANGYSVNLTGLANVIPNYSINANNCNIDFTTTGGANPGSYSIALATGNYTGPQLAALIQAALIATPVAGVVFAVTFTNNAFKITFTSGATSVIFNWSTGSHALTNPFAMMGYNVSSDSGSLINAASTTGTQQLINYAKIDQVLITSPAGEQPDPLVEMPWKDINSNIQQNNSFSPPITGIPQNFHITPDQSAMLIWPIAIKAYSGVLSFYQMPNVAAYNASTVLPFEDSYGLITALAEVIQRWDKENRSQVMAAVASQYYADYRAKHEDEGRSNTRQWRWGAMFKKRSSN